MKARVREWIRRYLPAEILSLVFTVAATLITYQITHSRLSTALSGTWFGNIGYFGYILIADIAHTQKVLGQADKRYTFSSFLKNIRALVAEFGIAELLDSFLVRPALMYYLPILTGSLLAGSVLAKFVADVTFYVPAIAGYELTKSRLRKFD